MKIRVRRFKHLKGVRYEVDLGDVVQGDGSVKRDQRFFRVREEAERFLDEAKRRRRRYGDAALAFSEEDRVRFAGIKARLAEVGASLEMAEEFYLRHHKPLREHGALSLRELLGRCLVEKAMAGLEGRSLKQLKSSCLSFIRGRDEVLAREVSRDQVKEWILGNKFAAATQRTYLGDLRTLFAWGVQERYLAVNVIAGDAGFIALPTDAEREIPALDVADCERLLGCALFSTYRTLDRSTGVFSEEREFRKLIGYLAICLFAGVRPEKEAGRSTAAEMDLRGRVLIIEGGRAKTGLRRVVELPRVAVVWLRLWRRLCPGQTAFVPRNFKRLWKALRIEAGLFDDWAQDVLRHSTATYHYALHKNLALLQAELGHSEDEDTLFRHYRAVKTRRGAIVSRAMAGEFWGLTPRRARVAWENRTKGT